MRNAALLALLLSAAACASPDALIDERQMQCGPGEAISIQAGLNRPGVAMEGTPDNLMLLVEVSNNSNAEVTVKRVRAQQVSGTEGDSAYILESVRRDFDVTIEEGKDHVFELPVLGRPGQSAFSDSRRTQRGGGELALALTVTLSNGDSYLCRFAVPSPVR